jgi:hypothetical protein
MQRNRAVRYLAAIACVGSLAPASVMAQGAEEFESVDPSMPVTGTRVVPGFGYRAEADIDDSGDASFSETAFSVRGGPSFTIGEDVKLAAFGSYRYSHYNFVGVGPEDPFENIHTFRLAPIFSYQLNEWTIYAGPGIAFSAEEGADWGKSFTGGALGGVHYKYNDQLSFGGGLAIFSQIEDGVRVLPIITANWDFANQWKLRIGFTEVAAQGGIGAEVTYDLNDQLQLGAGLQFQRKRFRIDAGDGVAEDSSLPIFVKAGYKLTPTATIEGLIGINVGGTLLIEDEDGQEVFEEDYDPSVIFGLRAVFTF